VSDVVNLNSKARRIVFDQMVQTVLKRTG